MAVSRERGGVPSLPKDSWWTRLWSPFWSVPGAFTAAAFLAGITLPILDRNAPWIFPLVFPGGPDGARAVLGAIAGAMISVIGLVFSITMVLLQLASSQFTPRILTDFVSSRTVQVTLGLFLGAFVFSLTVLRDIRGESEGMDAWVPQGSVTAAYILVLACVVSFLAFINHITQMIQVSLVVKRIGNRTVKQAGHLYPGLGEDESLSAGPTWSPDAGDAHFVVPVSGHGHVEAIGYEQLVELSRQTGSVIVLERPIGAYVVSGQPLARVWRAAEDNDIEQIISEVQDAVRLGPERSLTQDLEFGIRQLMDIYDRALSPGTNDPTTAIQVLNQLHRVFRELVTRTPPSPYIADEDGKVRIVHQPPRVEQLLRRVIEEAIHYGTDSVRVPRRLRGMLDDLAEAALPRHRGSITSIRERFLPEVEGEEIDEQEREAIREDADG